MKEIKNFDSKFSKKDVLENVLCKVVNKERNKNLLVNVPYVDFMDLAVVYYITVREEQFDTVHFIITNDTCKKLVITKEQLDFAAKNNTKRVGFQIRSMTSLLAEMQEFSEEDVIIENSMWVLSNEDSLNGASVLLFPEYFEKLAQSLNCNFYILPSSIHEVIAVPIEGMELDELKMMVKDINSTEVVGDDFLSDNVYIWNRLEKRFIIG